MQNDEPMDLDALNALDQAATNYIDYSKAMKAATSAPPQGTGLYVASIHSSALPQFHSTDQRDGIAQQYLPMNAVQDSRLLQLADGANLQNEVCHSASATDQSNRLGRNNDVESSSEPTAKADFDMSGGGMKRATVTDADLRTSRLLKRRMNKEANEKKAAKITKQKKSQRNRRKKGVQKEMLEPERKREVFENGNLPQAQAHPRRSRTDCKIAALQRRGRHAKRSNPQLGYSPSQSFSTATANGIPGPADGDSPAPSHPQHQQPLPNVPATSTAQPPTQLQPAAQHQRSPTPSPFSLVAICYDCKVHITDFPDSPYVLPTSCPTCHRPLIYRPFTAVKATSRFRHLPLVQRPAAQEALESHFETNPRLSTGSALTFAGEEQKELEGRGRKRRWAGDGKTSAMISKRDFGGETWKEPAVVHVDSEATEDEDEVVFIKEVSHNECEQSN